VDIYYAIDPHALTRFWRDAGAVKAGTQWAAACPVMSVDQPVFAFANVHYDTPAGSVGPGVSATFAMSSRVLSAGPARLKAAGVKATDRPDRAVDDGARGWHDWYRLNWGHPPLWAATTRKLRDPKWRGPDGATLAFDVRCETDNQLVLTVTVNAWGAVVPGQPAVEYSVVKPLRGSPDWQRVTVAVGELVATDPKVTAPPADWRAVTEFIVSPSGTTVKDGQKQRAGGRAWVGPREVRNLRWEGGVYASQAPPGGTVNPDDFKKNFDDAIRKSLDEEKPKPR
jgi:hypothetical protein